MPWLRAALLLPLSLASAAIAHADALEPLPPSKERHPYVLSGSRVQPTREEPADLDALQRPAWLQHVHIRKGAGFEVRRALVVGDQAIVLGVKGPVLKRKRLGFAIEVRF